MLTCTVKGCTEELVAKGLCNKHYKRQRKHGSLASTKGEWGSGHVNHGYRYHSRRGVKISEHRLVMEAVLGRRLKRAEDVHHINGDKLDNRPENLRLVTKAEHHMLHAKYFRNETHKECASCRRILPRTEFTRQAARPGRNSDPHISRCRPCWSKYVLEHRANTGQQS